MCAVICTEILGVSRFEYGPVDPGATQRERIARYLGRGEILGEAFPHEPGDVGANYEVYPIQSAKLRPGGKALWVLGNLGITPPYRNLGLTMWWRIMAGKAIVVTERPGTGAVITPIAAGTAQAGLTIERGQTYFAMHVPDQTGRYPETVIEDLCQPPYYGGAEVSASSLVFDALNLIRLQGMHAGAE
jgi:hypothetical protein